MGNCQVPDGYKKGPDSTSSFDGKIGGGSSGKFGSPSSGGKTGNSSAGGKSSSSSSSDKKPSKDSDTSSTDKKTWKRYIHG